MGSTRIDPLGHNNTGRLLLPNSDGMNTDTPTPRAIIHVDMDAFYASVEQRDFPEFVGKPLIVGGDPDKRGVVSTCNYLARQFGIHSAMPCATARRKCPHAVFVRPRFDVYREISLQIREILSRYTDLVEPLALDEAYLDVSGQSAYFGSSVLMAKDIRQQISRVTRLTASAGVSYNKFLAKIASDRCKPDGLLYISAKEGPQFAQGLSIRDFFGVGPATEEKMHTHGIYTGADLVEWKLAELQAIFGKAAAYYYNAARGIDQRPVEANRERKSVGTEDTFEVDLHTRADMLAVLARQSREVAADLARLQIRCRTITVKVKFADFSLVTRSTSSAGGFHQLEDIMQVVPDLLESALSKFMPVRLLGVTASNLTANFAAAEQDQIPLF